MDVNSCAKPVYPLQARRDSTTGTVTMEFLVGVDSRVKDIRLKTSSGSAILDSAAMDALRLCGFKAATVNGQPVERWTPIQYVWVLK
jgi:protein TonB